MHIDEFTELARRTRLSERAITAARLALVDRLAQQNAAPVLCSRCASEIIASTIALTNASAWIDSRDTTYDRHWLSVQTKARMSK